MDKKMIARELLGLAKELTATDFPTQDALDKYLKDHPDADKSNHKVVKQDSPKEMTREQAENHPYNLMMKRKNEKKMQEIGKHYKKDPKDLTVDEIMKYNQGKKGSVARELLSFAKELVAIEFPTQEALDKYLKDHPDADRSNHKVVKEKKQPAKKEKAELPEREDVENAFRDHLSQSGKTVTKESMKAVIKNQFKRITDIGFNNVWDNLVKEKYLIETDKGGFKWEM